MSFDAVPRRMWRDGGVRCAHRHPTLGLVDLVGMHVTHITRPPHKAADVVLDACRVECDGMVGFAALTATLRWRL